jgi:hypothetical protein
MKGKKMALIVGVLIFFIALSCASSELSWANKEATPDTVREAVGLPSIAVGNLNPAARNPGMELFCTGLYDTPGGYCDYFADGVPYINSDINDTVTVSDKSR